MKKFLTSVADIFGYDDSTGALLFVGKTLLDSSIETSLGNSDVRGGRGNQLQYVYYHSADMNITISDAQWNLDFLAVTLGSSVSTGNNVFIEETKTLTANSATVDHTPLALMDMLKKLLFLLKLSPAPTLVAGQQIQFALDIIR
jgi:hypothetical protein